MPRQRFKGFTVLKGLEGFKGLEGLERFKGLEGWQRADLAHKKPLMCGWDCRLAARVAIRSH